MHYIIRLDLCLSYNLIFALFLRELTVCRLGETQQKFNEKAPEGANLINGASNGIRFEPYFVELMHLCLHDEETIYSIKEFIINCND